MTTSAVGYLMFDDLTRDQIVQLKQRYMFDLDDEGTLNEVLYNSKNDAEGLSWKELMLADDIVPDDIVRDHYSGVAFSPDDFS